ncbi:hypothetical protein DRO97_01800 [Archaeoglobales archaeon]|nr:MAG: hypothetical protein DRO97_01800 [Archaeoglobales archaeon]
MGRTNLKSWLKVEIDNTRSYSDIRQINESTNAVKEILEKLLKKETDVENACRELKEIVFRLVGLLTGFEDPNPDFEDLDWELIRDEIIEVLRWIRRIYEFLTHSCKN